MEKEENLNDLSMKNEQEPEIGHPVTYETFDEVPVGKGVGNSVMMLEEFPEGYQPEEETKDVKVGPLPARMESKVWKVRQGAYEELAQVINDKDHEEWEEYKKFLVNCIGDTPISIAISLLSRLSRLRVSSLPGKGAASRR